MSELTNARGSPDRPAISASAAEQAELHVARGISLAMAGKRREAIALFHQALQLQPDHAKAHHNLGVEFPKIFRVRQPKCSQNRDHRKNDDIHPFWNYLPKIAGEKHYRTPFELSAIILAVSFLLSSRV